MMFESPKRMNSTKTFTTRQIFTPKIQSQSALNWSPTTHSFDGLTQNSQRKMLAEENANCNRFVSVRELDSEDSTGSPIKTPSAPNHDKMSNKKNL